MTYLIDTAKAVREIETTGLLHDWVQAFVAVIAYSGTQMATRSEIDSLKVYIRYHVLTGVCIFIAGLKTLEYLGE